MNHKFGLKTATLYSTLLAEFVSDNDFDGFSEVFEKFLDAYDADIKPDKTQTVQNFQREAAAEKWTRLIEDALEHANFNGDVDKFAKANGLKFDEQRDIPKVGEVYKDLFGHRFQIVGVFNEPYVATQTIGDKPLNEQIFQFASLRRFKFSDLTKED